MDNLNQEPPRDGPKDVSETSNLSDIEKVHISDMTLTPTHTMQSTAPSVSYKPPKLTTRNRSFLEHLCAGKSTIEAYRLAGYKGTGHAAYQLRCQLKEQLKQLLESEGFDRNGLKIKVKRMLDLGLDPEVKNLSPKMYLEVLKFSDKLMEHESESDIKISPFIINTEAVTINEPSHETS